MLSTPPNVPQSCHFSYQKPDHHSGHWNMCSFMMNCHEKEFHEFSQSIPPSIWHLIKLFAIWASSRRTLCSSHDLLLQPPDPRTVFFPTSGFHSSLQFHYQLIHYSSEQYSVLPGTLWSHPDGVVTFSTEILAVQRWKRSHSLNHLVLECGTQKIVGITQQKKHSTRGV